MTSLTACSGPGPGVAADVEGTQISTSEVDDFALLLCSLGGVPGGEEAATKSARQQALTLLIGNVVAFDLIDEDAVDPAAVEQAVAQNAQARETVPEDEVATFDAFVEDFSRAQIGLVELGRESLEEQGQNPTEITEDVAFAEGQRLRQERAAETDIELDPRFGSVDRRRGRAQLGAAVRAGLGPGGRGELGRAVGDPRRAAAGVAEVQLTV